MANIFPRWSNQLPIKVIVMAVATGAVVVAGVTYWGSPKYSRVGYMPTQPVPFDHSIHVKQVGLDCRYCHTAVETSPHSNVPPVQTCMSCHQQIKSNSPKLEAVRAAWNEGKMDGPAVPWVRIHKAPDYVYFNHAIHVSRGVSCRSCHGEVNEMKKVWHHESMSMAWCLDCHREPEKHVRDLSKVYDLSWKAESEAAQIEMGAEQVKKLNIIPPTNCAACHR